MRLVVTDDLQRNRLGVFFRVVLVIPHLIWLFVWGFGAFLMTIFNWVGTLFAGRSPEFFHEFLASYIRYVTHVYAYIYLAADRYPHFLGQGDYPVALEIADAERQNRWTVGFRLILAIPATVLGFTLANSSLQFSSSIHRGVQAYGSGGLLIACAVLAWFASLALGRTPRGLRDAVCYALFYNAQLLAYWFVLTDRYPNPDPELALLDAPRSDHPVRLRTAAEDLRRSRLTVFFRALLTVPHFVWLTLWGILALLAAIANWFATLVAGTPPAPLHRFLASYLRYQTRVVSYFTLLANPFPPFDGAPDGGYPLELQVAPPQRQSRWKVLFRIVLVLPALVVAGAYSSLLNVVALFSWFVSLLVGRMPRGLMHAGELALRYGEQLYAYLFVLTDSYPYSGPTAREPLAEPAVTAPQPAPALPG